MSLHSDIEDQFAIVFANDYAPDTSEAIATAIADVLAVPIITEITAEIGNAIVPGTAPFLTVETKAADFNAAAGRHYEVDAHNAIACTLPAADVGMPISVAISIGPDRVTFSNGTVNGDAALWIQGVNTSVLLLCVGSGAWRIIAKVV